MLMGAHLELARPFSPGPTMIGGVRSKTGSRNNVLRSSMIAVKHGWNNAKHDRRKETRE